VIRLLQSVGAGIIRATSSVAGSPVSDRGVRLDPELHRMLQLTMPINTSHPKAVAPYRREILTNSRLAGPIAPRSVRAESTRIAGRPARLYVPRGLVAGSGLMLYLHGGGFVVGDLDSHHGICAVLAKRARCRVLSLDYRLAPEAPYPAAPDDVQAAWRELTADPARFGADPDRLVVGGDSAGGNLSMVLAMRERDAGRPQPRGLVLLYPGFDFTRSMESHRTFRSGYFLSARLIEWFMGHYLTDPVLTQSPDVSPWWADRLDGLCHTTIITAGFDPLRDEGESFAERMAAAGGDVQLRCEESLIHGFASMTAMSRESRAALDRAAADVKRALGS